MMGMPRRIGLAIAVVLGSSVAHAQDEDYAPLARSAIASRASAADRRFAAGDAAGALAAYDALEDELHAREQFHEAGSLGCRAGVVRLRAQRPLEQAVRMAVRELGSGLAVAETEDARRTCLEAGARALVGAAQRRAGPEGASPELLDDLWFRAATWVRRARASGDSPALRAAHDVLPASTRAELEGLGSLAIEAPDAETLARSVERSLYVGDPTRIPDCFIDDDGGEGELGAVECYQTTLPESGFGAEYPHLSVYFLFGDEGVRAIGSAPRMPGYDCETGVVRETERFARLTRARDGIDGSLRVVRDGVDDDLHLEDLELVAHVCDAGRGECRSFRLGRRRCEPDAQGRWVCAESWEATVRSRRGVMTLRARRGSLPADVPARIELATLFAAAASGPGVRGARDASGPCHAEVADPRPPLNVRAGPDQGSAVAGTLANGTEVRPRERLRGWIRIDRPLAGWIWARNLRRVCQ